MISIKQLYKLSTQLKSYNYKKLYPYITSSILCLITFLLNSSNSPLISKTTTFLFLIVAIILSAWFGGLLAGLFTNSIALLLTVYLFLLPHQITSFDWLTSMYEVTVLTLSGVLISFVIETFKKTDLAQMHEKKEKEYVARLKKLEEENDKIQKEIKVRDEFLSIASHELKTPLTSMLLKLQIVLHNIRNVSLANFSVENLLKMLETAEQQSQRLSRMINDLLNVSVLTTGKINLELDKADLVSIVKEVIDEFSEKLEKEGYKLRLESDKSVIATVDKLRIEQVISNLLSNAIKYGNGKPIEVSVFKNHSYAHIVVKDKGIGIPPHEKELIFNLFERGATGNHRGLGIGLYIANQLIREHKGRIRLDSKPNAGSTFTVELPL